MQEKKKHWEFSDKQLFNTKHMNISGTKNMILKITTLNSMTFCKTNRLSKRIKMLLFIFLKTNKSSCKT